MMNRLTTKGALARITLAVALVLATFNPSGQSLVHWLQVEPLFTPLKALATLVILIGWFACVRTALVSLGWFGMALGASALGAVIWLVIDQGWLSLSGTGVVWMSLIMVGIILGVGLTWSILRAQVTGHVEVQ